MKTSKRTNKAAQAAAIAAIASTMGASLLPVNAEGEENVTKNEDVFVQLQADGSVKEVTVSDQLHSDTGFRNYDDKSNLKDVENLKSLDEVQKTSDGYKWTTDEKDIFYQGKSTDTLPLSVKITYKLDGKEMKAEDLPGKSGHLEMNVAVTNNEYRDYTVNGRQYHVAIPFVTVAGAIMDGSKFKNVTTSSGTVSSDSSHQIAAAVMMPGLEESIDGILDSTAMNSLKSYLIEDVTIEADVTDFEAPQMMLAASTNTEDLKEDIGGTDLNTIWDDLDDLQDATNKLVAGTQQLYDGAGKLSDGGSTLTGGAADLYDGSVKVADGASKVSDGANQVADGANKVNDGAGKLKDGADKLNGGAAQTKAGAEKLADGADQLYSGMTSLNSGLNTLNTNGPALAKGAQDVADAVLNEANNKLIKEGVVTADKPLTWGNYTDQLDNKIGITDQMRTESTNQLHNKIKNQTGKDLNDNEIDTLIYLTHCYESATGNTDFQSDLVTVGGLADKALNDSGNIQSAADVTAKQYDEKGNLDINKALADENVIKLVDAAIAGNAGLPASTTLDTIVDSSFADYKNEIAANDQLQSVYGLNMLLKNYGLTGVDNGKIAEALLNYGITNADASKITDQASAKQAIMTAITTKGEDLQKQLPTQEQLTSTQTDAYRNAANQALQAFINGNTTTEVSTTAKETYKVVLRKLAYKTIYTEAAGKAGKNAALLINYTALKNASAGYENGVQQALLDGGDDLVNASTMQEEKEAFTTNKDGLPEQIVKEVKDKLIESDDSYKELKGLKDSLTRVAGFVTAVNQYTKGVSTAFEGSAQLMDGASQLKEGSSTLAQGAAALADGTSTLATGAGDLSEGTSTLSKGASDLAKGASDLKDGASALSNGVLTLKNGADSLSSGINTLRDGAKDLMDGMEKYNDEGISKLTGSDKIADMKNADQLLTKMKQDSDNYDNYSGISDDASGKVKFVFKVNQVKQEKAKSSSSDDTADVTKSKDQANFFQKLINLFIFWKK